MIIDIAAPNIEPVTLDEAKAHLRLDASNDDAMLETYIAAARRIIEQRTRTRLMNQTIELVRDDFPANGRDLSLEVGNVRSVDSVTYRDLNGDPATLAPTGYVASLDAAPGVIRCRSAWPSVSAYHPRSVRVRMTAGYPMTAGVDRTVKIAVLLLTAHWYEHREPVTEARHRVLPLGVAALIDAWPMTSYVAEGA